jgi:hypothetical protein
MDLDCDFQNPRSSERLSINGKELLEDTFVVLSVIRPANIDPRIASPRMLLDNFSPMTGTALPNRFGGLYGGKDRRRAN